MVKTFLKIFFSGTKGPVTLGLGYAALGTWALHICSNDALGLSLTCLMARSNLLPYAFIWKIYIPSGKNVRKSFNGRNL